MRILFCGDIVGRSGREVIQSFVPLLRKELSLDCVIVNGENAAHGFGITPDICRQLYQSGVDVITTGNHVWDQQEIIGYIGQDSRLLRPLNSPPSNPGRGYTIFTTEKGKKILVANIMGRMFMDPFLDSPFTAVDSLFKIHPLGASVDAIIIDFHGEATSEKMAMGHFCDGRSSLVVGTHTHIPTADIQILPKGTAYQTDAGMCGDYDSVIGMKKDIALSRFLRRMPIRMQPAQGKATLCGLYVEIDDHTGLALSAKPLRMGGRLSQETIEP